MCHQHHSLNLCAKCARSPGIMHDRLSDCHPVSWAWMTSQLNLALIRKLHWSLMCLAYCFCMLSMGVCTTRHSQASGQLVQELNVCTGQKADFWSPISHERSRQRQWLYTYHSTHITLVPFCWPSNYFIRDKRVVIYLNPFQCWDAVRPNTRTQIRL